MDSTCTFAATASNYSQTRFYISLLYSEWLNKTVQPCIFFEISRHPDYTMSSVKDDGGSIKHWEVFSAVQTGGTIGS